MQKAQPSSAVPSPNEAAQSAPEIPKPKRVMGLRDLVMFYVVTAVSLRWIATAASAGPSSLVIWIVALLAMFLPLALCLIELSTRYPQEGGMYVWSKQAFGDFAGYITGWTYWTSNLPYFPSVLYFAASNALYLGGERAAGLQSNPGFFLGFSLAGLTVALVLNLIGLDIGKWLYNLGAIGTWLPIAFLWIVAAIALWKFGSATRFSMTSLRPALNFGTVGVWSTIVFAFAGAESASFLGGEILEPQRTIPRGLILAGILITTGYILGTVAVLVALPQSQVSGLQGIMQAITASAARIGWPGAAPLTAFLICIANIGAVGAWLAAIARIPFVVGIDRYLPPAFARVHPKWGTPYVALLVQALCGAVFIVLGQAGSSVRGAYQVLVSMSIITNFVPYLFVFAALIRLQREPAGLEVIRVPGGKRVAVALASLGFLTTCGAIVLSVIPDPTEPHKWFSVGKIFFLSAILLSAGVLLYGLGRRNAGNSKYRDRVTMH